MRHGRDTSCCKACKSARAEVRARQRGVKPKIVRSFEKDGKYFKYCANCKQTKECTHFGANLSKRDSLSAECKECHRARENARYKKPECRAAAIDRAKKYYEQNQKKVLEKRRLEYSKTSPQILQQAKKYRTQYKAKDVIAWRAMRIAHNAKYHAKKNGYVTDITKDAMMVAISKGCAITKKAFVVGFGKDQKTAHPDSPSVDRIECGGKYVMSNFRIVRWCINRARSNMGDASFKSLIIELHSAMVT
jgi:hypothetical protein